MAYETILYETPAPFVAQITLNRPKVYNAFNEQMGKEFLDALKVVQKDKNIRAVILTGSGDKAFCSGQDLKEVQQKPDQPLGAIVEKRYNPMVKTILEMEKVFIGALNGVAAGAGAGLILACDYVIAAEHASMLFAFINIGLVLDTGSSFLLPRLVGWRKAFELATNGKRISTEEMLRYGMINEVVSLEQLQHRALEVAKFYAEKPPIALGLTKKMLYKGWNASLEDALQTELYYQQIAGNTQDYKEGVQAFLEKRKPNFKGE